MRDDATSKSVLSTLSQTGFNTLKDWGLAAGQLLQRPLSSNSYLSKLISGYISVASQTYTGDINIMPSNRFLNPAKLISARSNKEILRLIREGEKAAWPNIEQIRLQTLISRRLWQTVKELDVRVIKGNPKSKKSRSLSKVARSMRAVS